MKSIKKISEGFIKELKVSDAYISENDKSWVYYSSVSGFLDDDLNNYYDVYFKEQKDFKEIEVCHTTKNPEIIVGIIKGIEPQCKVTYSVASYTSKTV